MAALSFDNLINPKSTYNLVPGFMHVNGVPLHHQRALLVVAKAYAVYAASNGAKDYRSTTNIKTLFSDAASSVLGTTPDEHMATEVGVWFRAMKLNSTSLTFAQAGTPPTTVSAALGLIPEVLAKSDDDLEHALVYLDCLLVFYAFGPAA